MEIKIKFGLGPVSFNGLSSIVNRIENFILEDGESLLTGYDGSYYVEITVPFSRSVALLQELENEGFLV